MMNALEVRIGETRVGILERFDDEKQRFRFCDEYINALIG